MGLNEHVDVRIVHQDRDGVPHERQIIRPAHRPHRRAADLRVRVFEQLQQPLGLTDEFRAIAQLNFLDDRLLHVQKLVGVEFGELIEQFIERTGRPAPETEADPAVEAELGDLLFTVVNLARFVNVDPELALRGATARFRERVERAEELAAEAGQNWAELDLDGQERWYEHAKATLGRPPER